VRRVWRKVQRRWRAWVWEVGGLGRHDAEMKRAIRGGSSGVRRAAQRCRYCASRTSGLGRRARRGTMEAPKVWSNGATPRGGSKRTVWVHEGARPARKRASEPHRFAPGLLRPRFSPRIFFCSFLSATCPDTRSEISIEHSSSIFANPMNASTPYVPLNS
jgi:hypothetical protein